MQDIIILVIDKKSVKIFINTFNTFYHMLREILLKRSRGAFEILLNYDNIKRKDRKLNNYIILLYLSSHLNDSIQLL